MPVIESNKLVLPTVFGSNTAAQLESDSRARAAAAEHTIYGGGRYEDDLKQRTDEAEIDQWYLDSDEEFAVCKEEEFERKRQQQAELLPPPPPPRYVKHLAAGRVAETLAPPVYKSSHAAGAQE